MGACGGQAVALGDGGVDGLGGDKEAVAVGAEEVGGGELGGGEVEVEAVPFVADDEVEPADGEGAFRNGLAGGDGLEEGAVEGLLEARDDAVDGAAGLKGGAGAGGGPGFAELLRAADVVGREDGGDGLAEGGELGLPGVDVGLEGGGLQADEGGGGLEGEAGVGQRVAGVADVEGATGEVELGGFHCRVLSAMMCENVPRIARARTSAK